MIMPFLCSIQCVQLMATPLIESEGDHSSDEDFSPGHLVIDMEGMGGVSPGLTHLVSDLKTIDRQICELARPQFYLAINCGHR